MAFGLVLTAHCTCKAGNSGYCNHVMSLLLELACYSRTGGSPQGKSMDKSIKEIEYSRKEGSSQKNNDEYQLANRK